MRHAERITQLRNEMQNQGVSGVFLPLNAHLEYFTGVRRTETGNTPQRQNSAEYASLLITETEVIYFNARLSTAHQISADDCHPLVDRVIPFPDVDLSGATFLDTCTGLGLKGQKLAYLQDISSSLVLRLQKDLAATWVNFDPVVQQMRAIKDPEELELMKKAAAVNDKIYDVIFPQLQPGVAIAEISREIDRLAQVFGADTTSFPTNVMNVGPIGGLKDYYPVLRRGYVVAFDYGVLYQGYCSDFGRTVFFGEPDPLLVKAHELVMLAQKTAIKAMKAGKITGLELNRIARQVINDGGYDKEFVHRLGHGIGKDVHERPFLAEGENRILEAGMCFTVEPSLKIQLPEHHGIIRVEDVILVTPEGGQNLNTTTRDLVVIE